MRTVDETGLCARDCSCARCEAGYRPTERERRIAARELADRQRRAAATLAAVKATIPTREPPRMSFGPRVPYTKDQNAELIRMRAAFRAGKKVTDDDY